MPSYTARVFIPQKDLANVDATCFDDALSKVGSTKEQEKARVFWMTFEDVYFNNNNNYIRINHGKESNNRLGIRQ